MMKNKAFTIIEVLVSVMIIATVATALFQISSRSKENFLFYNKKIEFANISSLALLRKQLSNTNLYEQIRTTYNIKDDELRNRLKKIKLKKEEKEISTIKINDYLSFKIDMIQIISKDTSIVYNKVGIK